MTFPTSRRAFLVGVGGVASATAAWGLWKVTPWGSVPVDANPIRPCCTYADYRGWIVTPIDKEKLEAAASAEGGVR